MATPAQKNALKGFTKTRKAATAAAKGIYKTVKGDRKAYKNKLLKGYKPSKTVKNLQQKGYGLLNKAENMGDFKYTSKYMPKAEDALETAKDMKFNMKYSLTDDPAYQSYRDQFVHNGQMAAQEAAGNMVANTGGFGSTAAQTASQQAYNESLTQLNNIVPELYEQAYGREWNKFENERNTMFALADAYQNMDKQAYDQALGTWENNFNQYMALAKEYNERYEYLDSAERAAFDKQLDGLLNLLTFDEGRYEYQTGRADDAAENAAGMANQIAADERAEREFEKEYKLKQDQFEEEKKQAAAEQAYKYAQLNEEKRQYDTTRADNTNNEKKQKKKTGTKTVQLSKYLIQDVGMSRSADGIKSRIEQHYKDGKINADERAALYQYFADRLK